MEGKIVEHWQHGTGLIVRHDGDIAVVLFEKDNKERGIRIENLKDESGKPLISPKVVGPTKSLESNNLDRLYEHIRGAGKPVFTDYMSAHSLVQVLNSEGADIGSAGTISAMASALHKRGLTRYAEGVKGSGWIVA
jgi:hypothetical protein